jgi:hypothetical protein
MLTNADHDHAGACKDRLAVRSRARHPTCKLLYTTPEQLQNGGGLRDKLNVVSEVVRVMTQVFDPLYQLPWAPAKPV